MQISPYFIAFLPKLRQRLDLGMGRAKVHDLSSRRPPTPMTAAAGNIPPRWASGPSFRNIHHGCRSCPPRAPARRPAASRRQSPTRGSRLATHLAPASPPRGAAEAPDPRKARRSPRGQRSQSHGGPRPPHWLRPSQSRRSPAAVGPGAAAPARTRSPCYALSNSPRYRVMCCCSARRRCRRPGCPGSSAALPGGRRGRGRGSSVQGAARLRRVPVQRPPQVMPPPPASA